MPKPRRAHHVIISAGSDDRAGLISRLKEILDLLESPNCIAGAAVGAGDCFGYSCVYYEDTNMTHEEYHRQLRVYLDEKEPKDRS